MDTTTTNQNLDAALRYATKYGWAVIPIHDRTKRPMTPHGVTDAKKDPGAIRHWWKKWPTASVGIATGSISQLIVIDEDLDPDKGYDGYREVRTWEQDHGALPETVRAITGRGGSHVYFHYTGSDIGNRAGILEGVDIRGEGGYVVAPPSIHQNGTPYEWEEDPEDVPLAEVDETVLEFLQIGKKKKQNERFTLPDIIGDGSRNDTLYRLACSLQEQGLSDEAILAAVADTNKQRCAEPLSDDEIQQIVGSALRHKKGALRIVRAGLPEYREPELEMMVDKKTGEVTDKPLQTIHNAEEAIQYDDKLYGHIFYNDIAYAYYVYNSLPWREGRGWREWQNEDDTNLWSYIEHKYGLKQDTKITAALQNVATRCHINPIKDMLEECHERWDGNKHIENLLPAMLGCEKNEYNTEALKLFMLGAIKRVYEPGCKFDYMLVLVGEQGKGKSSFLRFLALNDEWFNDNFSTLDGDKATEKLRGMWIVELAELQATKRAKDVETIKSFVTSRVDNYRVPYQKRTERRRRMCVLAGTSNPTDFLTDKTGNRRFLPVTCNVHEETFDMFADEIATKAAFAQAWGEAMDEYKRAGGRIRLVLPKKLEGDVMAAQTRYLEDDPNIGIIQEWLDSSGNDRVCASMIWRECLGHAFEEPKRQDINAIHDIMRNSIKGWKYVGIQRNGGYGNQRSYERIDWRFSPVPEEEELPFS